MARAVKRATIYFNVPIHKALRIKAAETGTSFSELVNLASKRMLAEDAEDLAAFSERRHEPLFSFEQILKDLKKDGLL